MHVCGSNQVNILKYKCWMVLHNEDHFLCHSHAERLENTLVDKKYSRCSILTDAVFKQTSDLCKTALEHLLCQMLYKWIEVTSQNTLLHKILNNCVI